jgi:Tfp pilus assembly protein PilZ
MKVDDKQTSQSTAHKRLIELINSMSKEEQQNLLEELEARLSKDARRHPRKSYVENLVYATQDRPYQDTTKNISEGGLFIETREPFSIGQKISLILSHSNHKRPIKIIGEVARLTSQGIGVKFKIATPAIEARIKSIVDSV